MSNQTVQRRPTKRRATSSAVAPDKAPGKTPAKGGTRTSTLAKAPVKGGTSKYRMRQTGRVEGLRDGKPLIFGWGRNLTRAQKNRYQRIALAAFAGLVILSVAATLVYGVLNELIFIPNATIVSVNGANISQDTYRKNLAVEAQNLWNQLQQEVAQDISLQAAGQKGDQNAATQDAIVQSQIQSNEGKYSQAVITQTAMTDLINNQLIIAGARQFEQEKHLPASVFDPSPKEINDALIAFQKAFPKNETYASFLSANHLTNADVRASLEIQLRSIKMQNYLATTYVSPTRQVHLRRIQSDTAAHAATALAALVKGKYTDATWVAVAKADSLDPATKSSGGDMGWVAPGSGDAGIEAWAYATNRKVGDVSPVIKDASGTYDVVQVLGIDPSRAVDAGTLKANQSNALAHWISMQTALPGSKVGVPDTTMLGASRNLPKAPNLNGALPTFTPPPSSGLPGFGG